MKVLVETFNKEYALVALVEAYSSGHCENLQRFVDSSEHRHPLSGAKPGAGGGHVPVLIICSSPRTLHDLISLSCAGSWQLEQREYVLTLPRHGTMEPLT